jgi:hypothetical protein
VEGEEGGEEDQLTIVRSWVVSNGGEEEGLGLISRYILNSTVSYPRVPLRLKALAAASLTVSRTAGCGWLTFLTRYLRGVKRCVW